MKLHTKLFITALVVTILLTTACAQKKSKQHINRIHYSEQINEDWYFK